MLRAVDLFLVDSNTHTCTLFHKAVMAVSCSIFLHTCSYLMILKNTLSISKLFSCFKIDLETVYAIIFFFFKLSSWHCILSFFPSFSQLKINFFLKPSAWYYILSVFFFFYNLKMLEISFLLEDIEEWNKMGLVRTHLCKETCPCFQCAQNLQGPLCYF